MYNQVTSSHPFTKIMIHFFVILTLTLCHDLAREPWQKNERYTGLNKKVYKFINKTIMENILKLWGVLISGITVSADEWMDRWWMQGVVRCETYTYTTLPERLARCSQLQWWTPPTRDLQGNTETQEATRAHTQQALLEQEGCHSLHFRQCYLHERSEPAEVLM